MKFYTDLDYFDIKNFIFACAELNSYRIHHMYFYMCLLPSEYKTKLIDYFGEHSLFKYTYSRMFNVKESFCKNIEDCDYVVLPPQDPRVELDPHQCFFKYQELIKKSLKENKKILFFYGSDNDSEFNVSEDYGYIFRNSGYLSEHGPNVLGCPTFNLFEDCKTYSKKRLSVSFCGDIHTSDNDEKYSEIRKTKFYEFSQTSYFNGIERKHWGGCQLDSSRSDFNQLFLKNRKEFLENIENNLYGLCIRGGGNYSFRLGEVFMMGRIPILIDTDCILPFKDEIPYKTNTVHITKENSNNFEFKSIDSLIKEYHNSHTENELIEIQKQNVEIWIKYFTIDYAFENTCRLLKKLDEK